jgi:hypothetical protein
MAESAAEGWGDRAQAEACGYPREPGSSLRISQVKKGR